MFSFFQNEKKTKENKCDLGEFEKMDCSNEKCHFTELKVKKIKRGCNAKYIIHMHVELKPY